MVKMRSRGRHARLGSLPEPHQPAHEARRHRRRVERARYDQRTSRASTRSRERRRRRPRLRRRRALRAARARRREADRLRFPRAARRTSSTARTSACSGASGRRSKRSTRRGSMPAPQESPERLETGTQNHEGIVGAAAAVDFLASLAVQRPLGATAWCKRSRGLASARRQAAREALEFAPRDRRRSTLYGPEAESRRARRRCRSHCAVTRPTTWRSRSRVAASSSRTATSTRRRSSTGSASAAGGGFVRAGCSCYTTDDEVDRLIDGVHRIAAGRA